MTYVVHFIKKPGSKFLGHAMSTPSIFSPVRWTAFRSDKHALRLHTKVTATALYTVVSDPVCAQLLKRIRVFLSSLLQDDLVIQSKTIWGQFPQPALRSHLAFLVVPTPPKAEYGPGSPEIPTGGHVPRLYIRTIFCIVLKMTCVSSLCTPS